VEITQENVKDGEITTFGEGYLDYLFGKCLHENPYQDYGDDESDDLRYYEWYDGWVAANK
jgi:hypothetical protein